MKTVTKTAISIPNSIFAAAERLSKQLEMSRSELYSRAIEVYIEENRQEDVTDTLNEIYTEESTALDPVVQQLQFASLLEDEW